MAIYPDVNGVRYDFSSIDINVEGAIFKGYTAVSYSHKLEPGKLRGTSPQVLGRTTGEYDCEGSVTLALEEWTELRAALGNGFMAKVFGIVVTYGNDAQPVTSDELVGCRIKNVEKDHSQGTDALAVKLDLDIMYIVEDGYTAVPGMRL